MPGRLGAFSPLWKWIAAGAAMDAGALLALYALLAAAGPLLWAAEVLLAALVLMAVAWYVHVVALPAIFRIPPVQWTEFVGLLVRGIALMVAAAFIVPVLGVSLFMTAGPALYLLTGGDTRLSLAAQTWIVVARHELIFLMIAAIVGAAIGGVLRSLRRVGDATNPPWLGDQPTARTDILGGALAAFLAGVGMVVATRLGLFFRLVAPPSTFVNAPKVTPQLPSLVLIGMIALLPHLLMTCIDLRRLRRL